MWIHGGAFVNGTGAVEQYSGAAFARDGVVAVTINYRLGVDGFGHIEGVVENRGLLDQIAALAWVRDNNAAFGGDPDQVPIGGESAGAMSVCSLIAAPPARGLFRRAIAQSGAGHHVLQASTAARVTEAVADSLGVEPTAAGLGSVAVDALIDAQAETTELIAKNPDPARWAEITGNSMAFEPVIDGSLLADRPIDVVAAGDGAPVELLIGSNDDEHALFLVPAGLVDLADENITRFVLGGFGAPETAYELYLDQLEGASPGEVLVAALTDWFFRIPALRMAEARSALGLPTHVYQFGWRSTAGDGRLGACHALEIGFTFDTLGAPSGEALAGRDAPQALAADMHAAWVGFVTGGDPGWPASGEARLTRRFGGHDDGAVLADPEPERRAIWAGR